MTKLCKHLLSVGACREALKWVGTRTARRAWLECDRADWLVWWAMSTEANRREDVVLVVCQCLRRAALRLPAGENRPQAALAAVESLLISPTAEHIAAAAVAIAAAWSAVLAFEHAAAAGVAPTAAVRAAVRAAATIVRAAASLEAAGAIAAAEGAWSAVEAAVLAAGAAAAADLKAGGTALAVEHGKVCLIIRTALTLPWTEKEDTHA